MPERSFQQPPAPLVLADRQLTEIIFINIE